MTDHYFIDYLGDVVLEKSQNEYGVETEVRISIEDKELHFFVLGNDFSFNTVYKYKFLNGRVFIKLFYKHSDFQFNTTVEVDEGVVQESSLLEKAHKEWDEADPRFRTQAMHPSNTEEKILGLKAEVQWCEYTSGWIPFAILVIDRDFMTYDEARQLLLQEIENVKLVIFKFKQTLRDVCGDQGQIEETEEGFECSIADQKLADEFNDKISELANENPLYSMTYMIKDIRNRLEKVASKKIKVDEDFKKEA